MTMTLNQPGTSQPIQFVNDDEGYTSWLQENPLGFVVNSDRSPKSSYITLHKAACKHINSPTRSNWTTTGYIKTCSTDVPQLEAWALSETGGSLNEYRRSEGRGDVNCVPSWSGQIGLRPEASITTAWSRVFPHEVVRAKPSRIEYQRSKGRTDAR